MIETQHAESAAVAGVTPLHSPPRASLTQEIARKLTRNEVAHSVLPRARRVAPRTSHVVDGQIARALAELVELDERDVVEGLAGCWLKYREVTAARTRTEHNPSAIETVPLHKHRITSTCHPRVTVTADPISHTLVFDLVVVFEVVGLAAVVQAGRVRSFEGGRCTAIATLKLDDLVLTTWSFAPDVSAVAHRPEQ